MSHLNIRSISRRCETSTSVEVQEEVVADILPINPVPPAEPMEMFVLEKTSDRICQSLALECDRLDLVFQESYKSKVRKTSELATISARRVSALKALGERLDAVSAKSQVDVEVVTTSRVLRLVKEAMRTAAVSPEVRELILQDVVKSVSQERVP